MAAALTPIHFREATAADTPRIMPLVESAFRGRGGWTTEADYLAGPRIDEAGLLAKITAPERALLLATTTTAPSETNGKTSEEQIIACCEVALSQPSPDNHEHDHDQPHAYFGLFAVLPSLQGSGLGRRLLAQAESYCRTRWRAAAVEMKVIASRAELVAWYVRRGYARTGRTMEFPFAEVEKIEGRALKEAEEMRMVILRKELVAEDGDGGDGGESRAAVVEAVGSLVVGPGEKEAEAEKGVVSVTAAEVSVSCASY